MITLFVLLLAFQLKHFFADYPLQNRWMVGKFKKKGWVLPLGAHAAVHALFTFVIALFVAPWTVAVVCALFDATVHFVMDRIKASPDMLGRYKAISAREWPEIQSELNGKNLVRRAIAIDKLKSNTYFWWALGLDQLVHHLTHYAVIWFLLRSSQ